MNTLKNPKMIENWQIKRLWAIASKIGFDKDELYNACNTDSLHKLSFKEANEVINMLSPNPKYNKPYIDYKKQDEKVVAGMISLGQKKKIWALMYELRGYDETKSDVSLGTRLSGVIKRELGISSTAKNPFVWINWDDANKLIEVLKKYVKHAKKRSEQLE